MAKQSHMAQACCVQTPQAWRKINANRKLIWNKNHTSTIEHEIEFAAHDQLLFSKCDYLWVCVSNRIAFSDDCVNMQISLYNEK